MVTDDQGKLSAKLRHLPYGEVHEPSSYGHERVQKKFASFTGQEMDNDTGLVYYHFRYYDPSLGRFLTPDNLIPGGGDDPQEYNRYAYVNGNPVKYTDPTGHWKCCKINPSKIIDSGMQAANRGFANLLANANAVKDVLVEAGSCLFHSSCETLDKLDEAIQKGAEQVAQTGNDIATGITLGAINEVTFIFSQMAATFQGAQADVTAYKRNRARVDAIFQRLSHGRLDLGGTFQRLIKTVDKIENLAPAKINIWKLGGGDSLIKWPPSLKTIQHYSVAILAGVAGVAVTAACLYYLSAVMGPTGCAAAGGAISGYIKGYGDAWVEGEGMDKRQDRARFGAAIGAAVGGGFAYSGAPSFQSIDAYKAGGGDAIAHGAIQGAAYERGVLGGNGTEVVAAGAFGALTGGFGTAYNSYNSLM